MSDVSGRASDASAAWAAEQSALLRGIAHALSNRVGTLGSVVGMLAPDAPVAAPILAVLTDESARLEALLGLVRVLAGDAEGGAPEPVHVPDLVAPVVALHAQHPDVRDVECLVDASPIDVPAHVAPNALVRALLVLLTAVKRDVAAVSIQWAAAGDGVSIDLTGSSANAGAIATARALLGDGARVDTTDRGARIVVPRFG